MSGFNRDQFADDCLRAVAAGGQGAVRKVLERSLKDSRAVLAEMGEPAEAGLDVILRSPHLTIFAAKWAPRMCLPAHDHRMWALIGIYSGREDNIYWRRTAGGIEATSANVLFAGDVATLPNDAIHSVTNPLERYTGGLHIYGGDFFDAPRSQWSAETLEEQPSNGEAIRTMFARENARLRPCA